MHGAGAAVREQDEVGRVAPLLGRDGAQGTHHRRVRELVDPAGGLERREVERPAEARERLRREVFLDGEVARGERARRDVAEQHVRVGNGGLHAAAPVTGRAGDGARAPRPDVEAARLVDERDRAAARADLGDVDRRDADQLAAPAQQAAAGRECRSDLVLLAARERAVLDQRRLRRRAAHVEADHVLVSERARERGCGDDARGRS